MCGIFKYILHPKKVILEIINRLGPLLSDKLYIKIRYRLTIGKKLDLKNPKTFNAKLQWLKLHDRNPEYTTMVDKYLVKNYVANIIGKEYIIPTLGVWNSAEEIDFDTLPNQFVLKCNHNSGLGMCVCKDKSKLNIPAVKQSLNEGMRQNFYLYGREWPYKNVKRKIIAEKYMEGSDGKPLVDYKLMCFNGKVKCSFTCTERENDLKVTFFDNNWQRLPFERHYPASKIEIPKPLKFNKMKELAETLSKNTRFLRVDFYEIDQKIYFGELTLYPGCGYEEFSPEKWDGILGDWIQL